MPKGKILMGKKSPAKPKGKTYINDVYYGDGYSAELRTKGSKKGNTNTIVTTGQDYYTSEGRKGGKKTMLPGESLFFGKQTTVLKNGRRESTTRTYKGNPEWNSEVQHARGTVRKGAVGKKKAY